MTGKCASLRISTISIGRNGFISIVVRDTCVEKTHELKSYVHVSSSCTKIHVIVNIYAFLMELPSAVFLLDFLVIPNNFAVQNELERAPNVCASRAREMF